MDRNDEKDSIFGRFCNVTADFWSLFHKRVIMSIFQKWGLLYKILLCFFQKFFLKKLPKLDSKENFFIKDKFPLVY